MNGDLITLDGRHRASGLTTPMNPAHQARAALLSLAVVGLMGAAGWRLEVEYHGWAGLTWLGYFHWAIPFGVALFVLWAALVSDVRGPARRAALAASLALAALPLYGLTLWALSQRFITGPTAFVARSPFWEPWLALAFLVLPVIPAAAALIARRFGIRRSWRRLLVAVGLWYAGPVIAIALLRATEHRGAYDLIHTIKSGFVVPFLVGALGVIFLPTAAAAPPR